MFLKQFFSKNGFPMSFIERIMGKTINGLINPIPKPPDDKEMLYFSLPYLGEKSYQMKNKYIDLLANSILI